MGAQLQHTKKKFLWQIIITKFFILVFLGSLKNISEDLTAASWYKLNSGWEGFYHVSYSEDALAKLNFDVS